MKLRQYIQPDESVHLNGTIADSSGSINLYSEYESDISLSTDRVYHVQNFKLIKDDNSTGHRYFIFVLGSNAITPCTCDLSRRKFFIPKQIVLYVEKITPRTDLSELVDRYLNIVTIVTEDECVKIPNSNIWVHNMVLSKKFKFINIKHNRSFRKNEMILLTGCKIELINETKEYKLKFDKIFSHNLNGIKFVCRDTRVYESDLITETYPYDHLDWDMNEHTLQYVSET